MYRTLGVSMSFLGGVSERLALWQYLLVQMVRVPKILCWMFWSNSVPTFSK